MPALKNPLKAALARGEMQLGLWLNSGDAVAAEIAAATGFDWCLIDGEHGPYDPAAMLGQMRAIAPSHTPVVVRVPVGEDWVIKQVMDMGANSLLIPMIDSGEQAVRMVRATRYAPMGVRGLGASVARVSGFGKNGDYPQTANEEVCLILQAETRQALENIEDIANTDGVDCVFIGPADLSADMGYPGNPAHPDVKAAIEKGIAKIRAAGKAAGIIHYDASNFGYYRDLGVTFLGIGADVTLMRTAFAHVLDTARKAVD
ncbi:MAG: HpcH/HpaI aldolase family protein [Maritimibacter sp.]